MPFALSTEPMAQMGLPQGSPSLVSKIFGEGGQPGDNSQVDKDQKVPGEDFVDTAQSGHLLP